VKFVAIFSLLMSALAMTAGGISNASQVTAEEPDAVLSGMPAESPGLESNAAPNLSGNWQISWADKNGDSKQATLQIRQDGNKVSGKFQGDHHSAPLTGSLNGNQVSLTVKGPKRQVPFTGTADGDKMSGTTQPGKSWTATRQ
jgi:hypothetical protein